MSRLLVCGSRNLDCINFNNTLLPILQKYGVTCVITGGAVGTDIQCQRWCAYNEINTVTLKPNYEEYGGRAPLIRDDEMVDMCDLCIGYWDGESHGTKYTIDKAFAAGKLIGVFLYPNGSTIPTFYSSRKDTYEG